MMLPVLKDFKNTKNIWCCSVLLIFLPMILQLVFYDATCFKRFQKYKKYLVFQCIPVFCLIIFLQNLIFYDVVFFPMKDLLLKI